MSVSMYCSYSSSWVCLLFVGFVGTCNADVFLSKEAVHLEPVIHLEHDFVSLSERDLISPSQPLTVKSILRSMPWCQVDWWSGLLRKALCGSMDKEVVLGRTSTSMARGAWLEFWTPDTRIYLCGSFGGLCCFSESDREPKDVSCASR